MMKLGDIVVYDADEKYMGVVLEVKHNVCKVIWLDHELIEWVPTYSLRIKNKN